MAIYNQTLKIVFLICLNYCWIQSAIAIENFLHEPLLIDNDSKIIIAQNAITIDELSYDDMRKRMSSSDNWMPSYKERRKTKTWGATISPGYSFWNPNNYNSFSVLANAPPQTPQNTDFASLYGTRHFRDGNTGYISFLAALKYNLPTAGALSLGLGVGYYKNKGSNGLDLFMVPSVAELTLTIDNIMNEPYVAPYAGIGLAFVYFKEKYFTTTDAPAPPNDPNASVSTTAEQVGRQFAFYYNAGVLLQLDWLEKSADRAMQLIGVENTYIKVGIIRFFRNIDNFNNRINKDTVFTPRDLTSKIALYVGLQLEF